ncbi:MAG: GGDEF domain-containing protein [Kiritimatiellia bacterium]
MNAIHPVQAFRRMLDRRSAPEVLLAALALLAGVGWIDHLTAHQLSLSVFYLFPIALATWYAPPPWGSVLSALAAAIWVVDSSGAAHASPERWILFWNGAVRLLFFLVTTRLLGQLKTALRRERVTSRTDSLTQVLNVRGFRETCGRLLDLAARHGHPATLAFIDLDNFKAVNDAHGHSAGDRVLQEVAAALVRGVRRTDAVGRLGGDEFGVFMPETALAGARTAFAKLRQDLLQLAADRKYPIGFSLGVAVFPVPPATLDEAIKAADTLMYRVKTTGKNNLVCEEQRPADSGRTRPAAYDI